MPAPRLPVVIASCVGPPFITRCLESLGKCAGYMFGLPRTHPV